MAGEPDVLGGGALTSGLARSLQLGRAQVDHRKAEEGERQRLMGERELDRNERKQRRNAEPDLEQSHGCKDYRAARNAAIA